MAKWIGVGAVVAGAVSLPGAGFAAASASSAEPSGKLLETLTFPGTAHVHNGPLLKTAFAAGKEYTLVISGVVDLNPSASYQVDPAYCFSCNPLLPLPLVQLTWFRGSTYSHWTSFARAPIRPYNPAHSYEEKIKPGFDARLRVGVGGFETAPQDNTGSFTVKVYGPPPTAAAPPPKEKKVGPIVPAEWRNLRYVDWGSFDPLKPASFCLASGRSWEPGGGFTVKTSPVTRTASPCGRSSPEQNSDVWSNTCAVPQTLRFVRTVRLPGPPAAPTIFNWDWAADDRGSAGRQVTLLVNSKPAEVDPQSHHLSPEARRLFVVGSNRLEVLVTRNDGACDAAFTGLRFWLRGPFLANLRGTAKGLPGPRVEFTIVNVGPSPALVLNTTLQVSFLGRGDRRSGRYIPDDTQRMETFIPFHGLDCSVSRVSPTTRQNDPLYFAAYCRDDKLLLPGESRVVELGFTYKEPSFPFTERINWTLGTASNFPGSNQARAGGNGRACTPATKPDPNDNPADGVFGGEIIPGRCRIR